MASPVVHRIRSGSCFLIFQIILIVSLFLYSSQPADAEISDQCGSNVTQAMVPEILKGLSALESHQAVSRDGVYSIPVQFHIVRQKDGIGGLPPDDIIVTMDSANALFAQASVVIYQLEPVRYVDEDYFYFNCTDQVHWDSLKRYNPNPAAVNVYWVPYESGFPYCGISSFVGGGSQGIIMNNACGGWSQPINSTLVHEIGHYFNLYHTHETAFGVECPEGSNCAVAGDLMCDTRADPNVWGHVSAFPACVYDNSFATPAGCDGTPYNPPVENLMSYAPKDCHTIFSPRQIVKFRTVLETLRPELEIVAGSLRIQPHNLTNLFAVPGNIVDTTLKVENIGITARTITSVASENGFVSITGPVPQVLLPGQSQIYHVTYDATGSGGACNLGQVTDAVHFANDDPDFPDRVISVSVNITYAVPTSSFYTFGQGCLVFQTVNTPALGNQASSGLYSIELGNVLFDASLFLGVVNGADTVVYQDVYSQVDFAVVDSFARRVEPSGRQCQNLRFVTKDGKLHGEVEYRYGWNSSGVDSCHGLTVVYTVKNLCDTTLRVATGVFADFDVDDYTVNDAGVNSSAGYVYVNSSYTPNHMVALASLAKSVVTARHRTIKNEDVIYASGSFPDRPAYRELAATSNGDELQTTDVGALLTFGIKTIPHDSSVSFPVAFLVSSNSGAEFPSLINSLRTLVYSGDYLCGDADGNGLVNISDAVFLISYVFAGGPMPFPQASGDVDCNGIITISDIVFLINYIFAGGSTPCSSCL